MLELIERVNWNEYLLILSQGTPPIGLQLLVINVVLVTFWLVRRTRKRRPQRRSQGSGWILQTLFVAGNLSVVTWGSQLSF